MLYKILCDFNWIVLLSRLNQLALIDYNLNTQTLYLTSKRCNYS